MNGHQVVGFPSRVRETFCQEFVKGLQSLQSPVLLRSDLAQVFPELNKSRVLLLFLSLLPTQDLVDLAEDEHRAPAIQFGSHARPPLSPQARQASQVPSPPA